MNPVRNGLGRAAALAGLALGLHARFVGVRTMEVRRFDLPVARLPHSLEGIRIALVADIHLGDFGGRPWTCPALDAAVDAVASANPDIVAICGDFGYHHWSPAELAAAAGRFKAPIRVAVLGNHDLALGASRAQLLRQALTEEGIRVLVNQAVQVGIRGETLWIAGLGSGGADRPRLKRVVQEMQDDSQPALLLVHKPDHANTPGAERFDLIVAGHTHGGQLAIPFIRPWIVRRFARTRFDRGVYNVYGSPMIVTKGLGMVGYHARFCARPEVVLLSLRASGAEGGSLDLNHSRSREGI